MTTDITELAQSLKAAANKAGADDWQAKKISGEFYVIRKGSYSSKCGYRTYQPIAEIDHKSTRDYVAIASPANILALVEALEKAQADGNEYAASERSVAVKNVELQDEIYGLKARIAELESRTVTDWIEHDGKWRPESLGLDELVYLKTRKQELKIPYPAGKVKGWMNTGGDMDVMAYKLASPQASTVTVKLPNQTEFDDPLSAYQAIERCKEALTADGIKWEAE